MHKAFDTVGFMGTLSGAAETKEVVYSFLGLRQRFNNKSKRDFPLNVVRANVIAMEATHQGQFEDAETSEELEVSERLGISLDLKGSGQVVPEGGEMFQTVQTGQSEAHVASDQCTEDEGGDSFDDDSDEFYEDDDYDMLNVSALTSKKNVSNARNNEGDGTVSVSSCKNVTKFQPADKVFKKFAGKISVDRYEDNLRHAINPVIEMGKRMDKER